MNCSQCGSTETVLTDSIKTAEGTVHLYWCAECLTESESVPPETNDREKDREMVERAGSE